MNASSQWVRERGSRELEFPVRRGMQIVVVVGVDSVDTVVDEVVVVVMVSDVVILTLELVE